MLRISGNTILLTRGDTAYITLNLEADGQPYTLAQGDAISVHVRNKPNTGTLLFEGTVEKINDDYVWHIYPDDTKGVDVKTYYYDVQLKKANGDIFTFISSSKFKITDEVTYDE